MNNDDYQSHLMGVRTAEFLTTNKIAGVLEMIVGGAIAYATQQYAPQAYDYLSQQTSTWHPNQLGVILKYAAPLTPFIVGGVASVVSLGIGFNNLRSEFEPKD